MNISAFGNLSAVFLVIVCVDLADHKGFFSYTYDSAVQFFLFHISAVCLDAFAVCIDRVRQNDDIRIPAILVNQTETLECFFTDFSWDKLYRL